jgi:hypothetical protein
MQYTKTGVWLGVLVAGLLGLGASQAAAQALVYNSPESVRPLQVGAKVPGGTLKTATGAPFDLAAAVATKPTVLVFYRGSW